MVGRCWVLGRVPLIGSGVFFIIIINSISSSWLAGYVLIMVHIKKKVFLNIVKRVVKKIFVLICFEVVY